MPRTQHVGQQILDDSLTGDDVKEETLVDSKVPFNEAGFSASNIHDAIVEASLGNPANPIFGKLNTDVVVPVDRAIVMCNPILNGYKITIHGTLKVI